ncbi:TetR/AcrR family transcriptional regulator [Kitasatospora kifunensis]|uniref:AcrR family transcriptional regulator n=1 Tax=Kitasatospora kifunensis TaxID=58351 RepID=A0A7W7R995_KITKI|nr:TetR/AcrR family transcriptional regulator [Kitasatospora kifunensis]MBB4927812.1 AcrR family transcriptional regulator [Kitasatospora kifunensis]
MAGDTRQRMIEATVTALQHRGVAGMSFTDVLASSGAARGAIYHHFPGGKAQLVAEAAERNGNDVRARLAALPADSPSGVVEAFLELVRPVVAAAVAGGGCAVAAVTVGAGSEVDDEAFRQVASTAFASWVDQLAERLAAAGLASAAADDLAGTLITLLEGAQVLCRAAGDLTSFDQVVRTANSLVVHRYPG